MANLSNGYLACGPQAGRFRAAKLCRWCDETYKIGAL